MMYAAMPPDHCCIGSIARKIIGGLETNPAILWWSSSAISLAKGLNLEPVGEEAFPQPGRNRFFCTQQLCTASRWRHSHIEYDQRLWV